MVNVFELVHVPSTYEVEGLEMKTMGENEKYLVFNKHIDQYRMEVIVRNTRANIVCL